MTRTAVLPARHGLAGLWRPLAALAAEASPPDRIIVLDLGGGDGLDDWLRLRWPGVELHRLAAEPTPAAIRALAGGGGCRLVEPDRPPAPPEHPVAGPDAWAALLADAVAGLPGPGAAVQLLRLDAEPGVDLVGLALAAARAGRPVHAATLVELSWPELAAAPAGAPLLVAAPCPLDAGHATAQLCVEEILRRCGDRPVRVVAPALAPSPPRLLSRLLDAALGHPDAQLWLQDAASLRYARFLLGRARAALVPPLAAALYPCLRAAAGGGAGGHELVPRGAPTDRLAPALAGLLGVARALAGPVLQAGWAAALARWSASRDAAAGPLATPDVATALLAAAAGRPVRLDAEGRTRDLARTWSRALAAAGVAVAAAAPQEKDL